MSISDFEKRIQSDQLLDSLLEFQSKGITPGMFQYRILKMAKMEDRVLVYGDRAINPNPTSEQLAQFAISSATTSQTFEIEP